MKRHRVRIETFDVRLLHPACGAHSHRNYRLRIQQNLLSLGQQLEDIRQMMEDEESTEPADDAIPAAAQNSRPNASEESREETPEEANDIPEKKDRRSLRLVLRGLSDKRKA